jgi:protein TonB
MIPTRNAESLLTHRVDPVLPKPGKKADQNPFARGTSFTTIVVVVFEIDKKGKVRRAMVVSGPQQLQAAALNAVKKWTFKPFTDHGAPTAVGTSFQLSFRAR